MTPSVPAAPTSRGVLLDVIRAARSISRVELARASGFTQATVSNVVRQLIDEGLVIETGRSESTGGKPRTMLAIEPTSRYAVGVQLGADASTFIVADLGGATVSRWRGPSLTSGSPEPAVDAIADELDAVVRRSGIDRSRLLGLGVVAPGPQVRGTGINLAPPGMVSWVDFPLRERLEAALRLPVLLDNDANAAAAGLYWADGMDPGVTLAALFMGQGIGAGLLTGGQVYRGSDGNAGEVGHVTVDLSGPECWCGNIGCVEAVAGPAALVDKARAAGLAVPAPGESSVFAGFAALSRLALAGDGGALALIHESAQVLAVAAHTLVNIADPDVLVLTGPAFALAGTLYLPVIADRVQRYRFARGTTPLQIQLSTHGPEAAALGAAALVLAAEVTQRGDG